LPQQAAKCANQRQKSGAGSQSRNIQTVLPAISASGAVRMELRGGRTIRLEHPAALTITGRHRHVAKLAAVLEAEGRTLPFQLIRPTVRPSCAGTNASIQTEVTAGVW
jgi:hypothetical protein